MEMETLFARDCGNTRHFINKEEPFSNVSRLTGATNEHPERGIDLNEQLIRNKRATFFMRVSCNSMINAGILTGDIVIVDRSIQPVSGNIVIAMIDGEMLIRRLDLSLNKMRLIPETPGLATIDISGFGDFIIWGVVLYVVRNVG